MYIRHICYVLLAPVQFTDATGTVYGWHQYIEYMSLVHSTACTCTVYSLNLQSVQLLPKQSTAITCTVYNWHMYSVQMTLVQCECGNSTLTVQCTDGRCTVYS